MDLTYLRKIVKARNDLRDNCNMAITSMPLDKNLERDFLALDKLFEKDIKNEVKRLLKEVN